MDKEKVKLIGAIGGLVVAIVLVVFFMRRDQAETAASEYRPTPEAYLQEQESRSGQGGQSEAELRQQRPEGE